jgi:hypothetical protein
VTEPTRWTIHGERVMLSCQDRDEGSAAAAVAASIPRRRISSAGPAQLAVQFELGTWGMKLAAHASTTMTMPGCVMPQRLVTPTIAMPAPIKIKIWTPFTVTG